jgi:hypothetical protein
MIILQSILSKEVQGYILQKTQIKGTEKTCMFFLGAMALCRYELTARIWNVPTRQGQNKSNITFWDVKLCRLIGVYKPFLGTHRLSLQGDMWVKKKLRINRMTSWILTSFTRPSPAKPVSHPPRQCSSHNSCKAILLDATGQELNRDSGQEECRYYKLIGRNGQISRRYHKQYAAFILTSLRIINQPVSPTITAVWVTLRRR